MRALSTRRRIESIGLMLGAGLCGNLAAAPVLAQTPASPAAAAPATAALPAWRNRILAVYDESGDPIEGVEILDIRSGIKAMTTKTGTVSLVYLPEGGSLIRTRKLGFESRTQFVAISEVDTLPIMIMLARAVTLPTVVVKDSATNFLSPGLGAFEERRKSGLGHFITEEELRKNDNVTLGNVIASRVPGITTRPAGSSAYLVSTRKTCAGPVLRKCLAPDCLVTVIQDGVRIFDVARFMTPSGGISSDMRGVIPDFNALQTRDYAAVEFYAGGATIPAQYNITSSDCGVLLLWTRRR